jgi:diguanylate cyclase (GGDEF)-like protein/PAS domain S-box-containing protein
MLNLEILKQAVMDSRDGITISDNRAEDNPLIFVNPAFERLTGYSFEEITNRNCRYLQNSDRDQPGLEIVRRAIEKGQHCLVTLRNYRKDGTMFWNELSISPMYDEKGAVAHFLGIQKDVTSRTLIEQQLRDENQSLEKTKAHFEQLSIKDGLTGIYNRRFFDLQLDVQCRIARRNGDPLALLMVDVDHFKQFNDTYGHQQGDSALKMVAGTLNTTFQRASDFIARYGGEEFILLSAGMTPAQAALFADDLCQRVRSLGIAHSASRTGFLTVSVGFSVRSLVPKDTPDMLLERTDKALYTAKQQGRNRSFGIY